MNKNTRTLVVLVVALVTASVASYGVYRAVKSMPVREVEVAHTFVIAATRSLPAGTRVTETDVKLVAWPERSKLAGTFDKVEQVVNRGVIMGLLENEPISEGKLAPIEAGAGLAPTIPPGMRAISVRVNEVVGVAGFVTPGTRVDVFVTLKQRDESITRIVAGNVTVLTAGTRYDEDKTKAAEAIPSSVVTLLLTPTDAERVVLASNDGAIMLALRNPLDVEPTAASTGTRTANLFGDAALASGPVQAKHLSGELPTTTVVRRPRPAPVVVPAAVPVAPVRYSVEAIRGAKRSEETLQ